MVSNTITKLLEDRTKAKEFIQKAYDFKELYLTDFEIKIKPLFLDGKTLLLYCSDNPPTDMSSYVIDAQVCFPSTLDSVSSRNVGPFPHANQGDLIKSLSESLWIQGNYMFATWNQVHAAASKHHSGFLSVSYKGSNFSRIIPDVEYRLRTKLIASKEPSFYSVLYSIDGTINSVMEGIGQTTKLPLYHNYKI